MSAERVMGADASRAVERFSPDGPAGFVAATRPNAPLRASRAEAVDDELAWLESAGVPLLPQPEKTPR